MNFATAHRIYPAAVGLWTIALLANGSALQANPFTNGDFEEGLTGWKWHVRGGHITRLDGPGAFFDPEFDALSLPVAREYLASSVAAVTVDAARFYPEVQPAVGEQMLRLFGGHQSQGISPELIFTGADGHPYCWRPEHFTVSLEQTFEVTEEGTISGFGRFRTEDFPVYSDNTSVTLNGTEIWKTRIKDIYSGGSHSQGAWEPWSATVSPGQYTIALNIFGDDLWDSWAFFDGITVRTPDAGCTGLLLGLALLPLRIVGRRRPRR